MGSTKWSTCGKPSGYRSYPPLITYTINHSTLTMIFVATWAWSSRKDRAFTSWLSDLYGYDSAQSMKAGLSDRDKWAGKSNPTHGIHSKWAGWPSGWTLHWVGLSSPPARASLLWEQVLLLLHCLGDPSHHQHCDHFDDLHTVSHWDWSLLVSSTLLFCSSYSFTSDHAFPRSCQLLPDLSLRQSRLTCFNGGTLLHIPLQVGQSTWNQPQPLRHFWQQHRLHGRGYDSDSDTAGVVISVSILYSPLASPCVAHVGQGVSGAGGGASAT